jgi:hypothetical protein
MKIDSPSITGSFTAQNGLTGSLFGTASWASQAISASYITSSFFTGANVAASASYALTASYAANAAASSVAETYSIFANMGGTTLAANTIYYIGQGGYSANTTANRRNVYIPFAGALVAATITTGTTSTTVTAADVAVAFRLNNTSDTSLGNVRFTGGNANSNGTALSYNITGLNTTVAAGDFFEIKITTPVSYAAPPTAASITVMLYFTRTS